MASNSFERQKLFLITFIAPQGFGLLKKNTNKQQGRESRRCGMNKFVVNLDERVLFNAEIET